MASQTSPPTVDSTSSELPIPLVSLRSSLTHNASSSSSDECSHESPLSTPASSFHSPSPSRTSLHTPKGVSSAASSQLSDSATFPNGSESPSSPPSPSSSSLSVPGAAPQVPNIVLSNSVPAPVLAPSPSIHSPRPPDSSASLQGSNTYDLFADAHATARDIPRSIPDASAQDSGTNIRSAPSLRLKTWTYKRSWWQNALGSVMLAATLIGLFVYQRRSYRIAVWTARNDFYQSCLSSIQSNAALPKGCVMILSEGVGEAPYTKRAFDSVRIGDFDVGNGTFGIIKRRLGEWMRLSIPPGSSTPVALWEHTHEDRTDQMNHPVKPEDINSASTFTLGASATCVTPDSNKGAYQQGCSSISPLNAPRLSVFRSRPTLFSSVDKIPQEAWVLMPIVATALLFLELYFWRRSRAGTVITSQARTEVEVTRHQSEGVETTSSHGPVRVTKEYPRDNHPLHKLRRRIVRYKAHKDGAEDTDSGNHMRHLDWNISSTDTLVGHWTGPETSEVSLKTYHDDKHQEGLIELKSRDSTKHLLDPDTGEVIHISPWKSTYDDKENRSTKVKLKSGTVGRAIAQMSVGSAAFVSRQIDEKIMAKDKKEKKEKELIPPQAGDCVTGMITNDTPTGKPTLF